MLSKLIEKIKEQKKRIMIYSAIAISTLLAGYVGNRAINAELDKRKSAIKYIFKAEVIKTEDIPYMSSQEKYRKLVERQPKLEQNSLEIIAEGKNIETDVTIENTGEKPIKDVYFWQDTNYYDINTFLLSVLNQAGINEENVTDEKVVDAFVEFFPKHKFHDFPPEGMDRRMYTPNRTFTSTGYWFCGNTMRILGDMCESYGIPARDLSLKNHVANEVFINGKWRYVDAELPELHPWFNGFFRDKITGERASFEQLIKNPERYLTTENEWKLFDGVFKPDERHSLEPSSGSGVYIGPQDWNNFPREQAKIAFELFPRQKVIFKGERGGICWPTYPGHMIDPRIHNPDIKKVPYAEKFNGLLYSNGTITWVPDIIRINSFIEERRNIEDLGIETETKDRQKVLKFFIRSSYPIVNSSITVGLNGKAKMISEMEEFTLITNPQKFYDLSNGNNLIKLNDRFSCDGTYSTNPRFDYSISLILTPKKKDLYPKIKNLSIESVFQYSWINHQLRLNPGKNIIHYYGPPLRQLEKTQGQDYTTTRAKRDDGLEIKFRYKPKSE